jgi:hypothetical protein
MTRCPGDGKPIDAAGRCAAPPARTREEIA